VHQRILIRKAIKDLLVAGGTDAGGRVFTGRVDPLFRSDLPAILIYSTEESVEREDIEEVGLRKRTAQVVVKGAVRASAGAEIGFDDQLDALAEQIEAVMDANPLLNQTAETVWFDETEFSLSGESEDLLGVVSLTYSISYRG
jgi:hypothetical protein